MHKVIGIVHWHDGVSRKVKVIAKHQGKIIKHVIEDTGEKIDHKSVIEIMADHAKIAKARVNIPNHIREGLERKE